MDSIARQEQISPALAQIMVEELSRSGRVMEANSLCASGLGACGGGTGDAVALHCAGCPLIPLRTTSDTPSPETSRKVWVEPWQSPR